MSFQVQPSIFQRTIFTSSKKLYPSLFVRPMHPKTEIRPTEDAIHKILALGWIGQLKIHGHRAQIHLSSNPKDPLLAYNRHGQLHKKEVPTAIVSELRRIFAPETGWNILDAEWIKEENKMYVFDFITKEGKLLNRLSFMDRWKLLPRAYLSPSIQTLGILTSIEQCLSALARPEDHIEGIVFKSQTPGFEDSSIIRCRKKL